MSTMTKEAKVKIGFDINKESAKKDFQDTAKAAELLEKAIDKAGQKQKALREEFGTNRMQTITGAFGAVSKAASGMSEEVAKALSGFSTVTSVIEMFNSLNGSIQGTVKSLREMKAIGATMTTLQGIQYAGGGAVPSVAGGAVTGAVRGTGTSIMGAAAGGALVSAAGQFATTTAASQVKSAIEKATEKLGDKAEKHADSLFDSVIDSILKKKKPGSSLVPSGGAAGVGSWPDVMDAKWSFNTPRMIGRDQTNSEYVRDALLNAAPSVPMGQPSLYSRFMNKAGTEFYSPKNRWNALGGGLVGATAGGIIGYGVGGAEGAAAGGGIGALAGGAMSLMSGGGLVKSLAGALATPLGAAIGLAVAAGASLYVLNNDKAAEALASAFFDTGDKAVEKAQKKLAAKRAEMDRRETIDSMMIPIRNARREAFEGIRAEQSGMNVHRQLLGSGRIGSGLDASIEYGGQNLAEANSRLMQATAARFRGVNLGQSGNPGRLKSNEAHAWSDFSSQLAAQRQLTEARASGQLTGIDTQLRDAESMQSSATINLDKMLFQKMRVDRGEITESQSGVTKAALNDAYDQQEKATRRLIDLEKQRNDIKKGILDIQKQEFAVIREQARSQEQVARQALADKEGAIASARQEFGVMGEIEQGNVIDLAKKFKQVGYEGMSEAEKQYMQSKPTIFGADLKPQIDAFAEKSGFGTLQQMLSGLTAQKETAALKQAEAIKVDVERTIIAQLTANEEKLADELASRVGPLYNKLTIMVTKKFDEMSQQMESKIEAAIQKNKAPGIVPFG